MVYRLPFPRTAGHVTADVGPCRIGESPPGGGSGVVADRTLSSNPHRRWDEGAGRSQWREEKTARPVRGRAWRQVSVCTWPRRPRPSDLSLLPPRRRRHWRRPFFATEPALSTQGAIAAWRSAEPQHSSQHRRPPLADQTTPRLRVATTCATLLPQPTLPTFSPSPR